MPQAYVQKIAVEKGVPVSEMEARWNEAKKLAKEQGHEEDYDYITAIFKKLAKVSECVEKVNGVWKKCLI